MADVNGELRAKEWATHKIKTYDNTFVYVIDEIVDDFDNAEQQADPNRREHERRCVAFEGFFYDCLEAGARKTAVMAMLPGETQQDWDDYWFGPNGQFTTKTANDLMIITYAGEAYGEDAGYTWRFRDNPNNPINATRFIRRINRTDIDCMLILDCDIPTRFSQTWKRYHAMTEIIAMPMRMRDANGPIQHAGDMQTSVVRNLTSYVNDPVAHRVIGDNEVMKSLPELMALDNIMYSNATRVWSTKPWRKPDPRQERPIWRFKLDPFVTSDIQALRFYGVHIQPDPRRLREFGVDNEEIIGENFVDEGMGSDIGDEQVDEGIAIGLGDDDDDSDDGIFVGQ